MNADHVILLHGLCRSARSMRRMATALSDAGFVSWNVDYPSRSAPIAVLSESAIGNALAKCRQSGATTIHFVTHSMGGILVRCYLARHPKEVIGRVVMLAPPNQGSEVVDRLKGWRIFQLINGPAGSELGTESTSLPNALGPIAFPLGVIAGNRSINLINSRFINGADDGKVAVERTKVSGMSDHRVVAATHPFIMNHARAIRQTIHFLQTGRFEAAE